MAPHLSYTILPCEHVMVPHLSSTSRRPTLRTSAEVSICSSTRPNCPQLAGGISSSSAAAPQRSRSHGVMSAAATFSEGAAMATASPPSAT
jgi:hypothetical protein